MSKTRPDFDAENTDKRHPIQVVGRRTGISPDLLRTWERRYGVVDPARTAGGRRLYSDTDIEHLRLLQAAVDGGRAIGQVAPLARAELAALVHEDRREALVTADGTALPATDVESHLETALAALRTAIRLIRKAPTDGRDR